MKSFFVFLVFTLFALKVKAVDDGYFVQKAIENPGDTILVQEYNSVVVFPRFLGMKDFFHAETSRFAESGVVFLGNRVVPVKNYVHHKTIFAWWNVFGIILLILHISLRSFQKNIFDRFLEPIGSVAIWICTMIAALCVLGLQIFCNIFEFNLGVLFATVLLFLSTIFSYAKCYKDENGQAQQVGELVNKPPRIEFIVTLSLFFIIQFI